MTPDVFVLEQSIDYENSVTWAGVDRARAEELLAKQAGLSTLTRWSSGRAVERQTRDVDGPKITREVYIGGGLWASKP